ncbi:MAG: hypothetical protein JSU83_00265 [Deltaproteobacteria bacterium]|nr:MAG: hypothetical protein JSU83_00265 [Deltaproteobacteria bacterium]
MKTYQHKYSIFHEGIRRYEIAMQGIPDRVPMYAQLHDFARKEKGVSAAEFYTNSEILVTSSLETMKRWGVDYPIIDYDVYNIEAEALGQKIFYSANGIPDIDRTQPLIQSHGDLKKIKTPDFKRAGRFPQVLRMYSLFRELTDIEPDLNFCAPFTLAANLRGIEQLLMDILMAPGFARDLLTRITEEVLIPWIWHLKSEFPETKAICGSDAMSSLPIVNLDILEDWSATYISRLRQACGSEIYVPNWIGESHLKDPLKMFDLKLKVCPRFLEGQDPDVAHIGPEVYKEYAENKGVALILGIGSSFLTSSRPQDIVKRIQHYITAGGKNGRFCLYLCSVDSVTPVENLKAAVQAIHRFGTYSK